MWSDTVPELLALFTSWKLILEMEGIGSEAIIDDGGST